MFVKMFHQFFSHKNKKVDSPTFLNPSGGGHFGGGLWPPINHVPNHMS